MRRISVLYPATFTLVLLSGAVLSEEKKEVISPRVATEFGLAIKVRAALSHHAASNTKAGKPFFSLSIIEVEGKKLEPPLVIHCLSFDKSVEDDMREMTVKGDVDVRVIGYEKIEMNGLPKNADAVIPNWPVPADEGGWVNRHIFVVMSLKMVTQKDQSGQEIQEGDKKP